MAKAKIFTGKKVPKLVPGCVKLRLTAEESQALFDVLHRIGGSPKRSARGLLDNIRVALHNAGVARLPAAYDNAYGNITYQDKNTQ